VTVPRHGGDIGVTVPWQDGDIEVAVPRQDDHQNVCLCYRLCFCLYDFAIETDLKV
jgi:hypothetical protein